MASLNIPLSSLLATELIICSRNDCNANAEIPSFSMTSKAQGIAEDLSFPITSATLQIRTSRDFSGSIISTISIEIPEKAMMCSSESVPQEIDTMATPVTTLLENEIGHDVDWHQILQGFSPALDEVSTAASTPSSSRLQTADILGDLEPYSYVSSPEFGATDTGSDISTDDSPSQSVLNLSPLFIQPTPELSVEPPSLSGDFHSSSSDSVQPPITLLPSMDFGSRPMDVDGQYTCPFPDCIRQYKRPGKALKAHLERHVKPRRLPCSYKSCKAEFSRQHDRLRHEVTKHGKQCPWTCSRCRKFFGKESSLKRHTCSQPYNSSREEN